MDRKGARDRFSLLSAREEVVHIYGKMAENVLSQHSLWTAA